MNQSQWYSVEVEPGKTRRQVAKEYFEKHGVWPKWTGCYTDKQLTAARLAHEKSLAERRRKYAEKKKAQRDGA